MEIWYLVFNFVFILLRDFLLILMEFFYKIIEILVILLFIIKFYCYMGCLKLLVIFYLRVYLVNIFVGTMCFY